MGGSDMGGSDVGGSEMGGSEPSSSAGGELTIKELEDWLLSGAQWRVVDIANSGAEVQFCTCTGTALDLRRTSDPAVIAYLRTAHAELDSE